MVSYEQSQPLNQCLITDESTVNYCRQNGVGLNSMCGRVAGILAPLVTLLDVYHYTIPMLIYGIVPIVAGGLCLLLPETLNVELQDHTELKWVLILFYKQFMLKIIYVFKYFYIVILFFLILENQQMDLRGTDTLLNKLLQSINFNLYWRQRFIIYFLPFIIR